MTKDLPSPAALTNEQLAELEFDHLRAMLDDDYESWWMAAKAEYERRLGVVAKKTAPEHL